MNNLQERVLTLFDKSDTVSTDDLAEALYIKGTSGRTRTIRNRLRRAGIHLEMVGYQTWVRV